jgi:DNA-binding NarL/FixJ family response regulator
MGQDRADLAQEAGVGVTSVLVCHRDGLAADALRVYLSEQGFQVELAGTSDEILEQAKRAGSCLVDMGMRDVRSTIRQFVTMPDAPRVFALANRDDEIRTALEAGADVCVATADGLDRLVHLLRSDIVVSQRASAEMARTQFTRMRVNGNEPHLTARELEVLAGLVRGESTKVLAERLQVKPATARTHVQHLLAKLGVHSRLQAVAFVIENPIDSLLETTRREEDRFAYRERTAG